MSANSHTSHIVQSLFVNLVIAILKLVGAVFTKSGSMLAEGIHSCADCCNQALLLWGVREGQKPADDKHPLGYGRNVYFWSFMVALLLFTGGGVFSVYEGIHKLQHPEPVQHVGWAIGILSCSLLLESWATYGNIKTINTRRGSKPFFRFLKETKDSDLVVVFGENSAAVLGLAIALASIAITMVTGDARADAAGSLLVGVVLIAVAVFLAVEVKSLLVGESADSEINLAAEDLAIADPKIHEVTSCITMQQGPGEVLVALKIVCAPGLTALEVSTLINEFEARLRGKCPEAKWIYVEPDLSMVGETSTSARATAAVSS